MEKEVFLQRVAETVNHFFQSEFNATPSETRVMLEREVLIIRLVGIFSQSETELASTKEGAHLINRAYDALFCQAAPILEKTLSPLLGKGIKSLRMDMNLKDGECFCFFTFSEDMEEKLSSKPQRRR